MHLGPDKLERYELRSVLARSATGAVYEGWDTRIARKVAIKTVLLGDVGGPELDDKLERFQREAQSAGQLQHPNIVAVYDYGETDAMAYIVMEMVEGPTLKALFEQNRRLELPQVVSIMEDVLAALQYSHERGVIHRDVKPANIMMTSSGRAKLTDFGIARIDSSSMTHVGTVMGTPAYMSPEQFLGEVVDKRTDIYSAGVVLYQMLTGERPFEGSAATIMHKVFNVEPRRPSELSLQTPPAFDAIVDRAMAKKREDRFPDAAAFAARIRVAGSEVAEPTVVVRPSVRPAPSQRVPPPRPPSAEARKSGNVIAALATGLIALAGIGGGAFWYSNLDSLSPSAPAPAQRAADLPPPIPAVPQAEVAPAPPVAPASRSPPATTETRAVGPSAPADTPTPPPSPPSRETATTVPERIKREPTVPREFLPPTAELADQEPTKGPPTASTRPPEAAVVLGATRWWPGPGHGSCSQPTLSGSWQHGASAELMVINDGLGCGKMLWANMPRHLPFRSLTVSAPPTHGRVRVEGSRFVYQPESGFAGSDSFALGGSPPGSLTVNVTVLPPEAPREAGAKRSAREGEPPSTSASQSWIGARLVTLTDDTAQRIGLRGADGVMIDDLTNDGPARQAHLQPGDVILAFNSAVVNNRDELARAILATPVGTAVPVEVWHDHRLITVQLVTTPSPR